MSVAALPHKRYVGGFARIKAAHNHGAAEAVARRIREFEKLGPFAVFVIDGFIAVVSRPSRMLGDLLYSCPHDLVGIYTDPPTLAQVADDINARAQVPAPAEKRESIG